VVDGRIEIPEIAVIGQVPCGGDGKTREALGLIKIPGHPAVFRLCKVGEERWHRCTDELSRPKWPSEPQGIANRRPSGFFSKRAMSPMPSGFHVTATPCLPVLMQGFTP
jgi:hypothetical protein